MSTFNPGTNEPTPERGSAKDDDPNRPSENPQVDELRSYDQDETPEKVEDIKAWLDHDDSTERTRRANLVERTENSRTGGPRPTVTKAVEEARDRR